MKTIIDYIRSCFCRHEYELLSKITHYKDDDCFEDGKLPTGYSWVYFCKKCGSKRLIKDE